MKRTIIAAAILSVSASAFATNNSPAAPQANAEASGVGIGIAGAHSSATGIGIGVGQGGDARASGTAFATSPSYNYNAPSTSSGATVFSSPQTSSSVFNAPRTSSSAFSGGNTQTVNFGGVPAQQTITHNGRSQVETVPNVFAPNIYPTAPCMGSSSVGAGWLGFGMSGGTSWTDTECQIMEASRNAPTPADRVYVWCKSANAAGAPSCAGLKPEPTATTGSIPVARDRRADATVRADSVWKGGE